MCTTYVGVEVGLDLQRDKHFVFPHFSAEIRCKVTEIFFIEKSRDVYPSAAFNV